MDQPIVWSSLDYPGMEYLTLRTDDAGIEATGVVVGVENAVPFRLDYRIACEPGYAVRALHMALAGRGELHLIADGLGHWLDGDGAPLPELDGCIDVDISATPFTNTLPINRLDWQIGQAREFRMVYVLIPDLTISAEPQRYTCLDQNAAGATFRFEALSSGFTAILPVDSDGLVRDYPGLFRREWPT